MRKALNCILNALLSAFLTFAWCRYLLHDNTIAAIAACVVGFCFGYISAYFSDKGLQKDKTKKQREWKISALSEMLSFNTDNSALLAELLAYYNYTATSEISTNNDFFVMHNDKKFFVTSNFLRDKLTSETIRYAVVQAGQSHVDNAIIFCNNCDNQAAICADRAKDYGISVKIIDIRCLSNLLLQAEKMPTNLKQPSKNQPFDIVASFALCRKRSVHYFSASVFFVIISFISYIKLYNLVWATVLFCLGMYSLLNKRYNVDTFKAEL